MFVSASRPNVNQDLIAHACAVEVGVRVRARDPDVGVAAVSTPFTCRALASNVPIALLYLLQYLTHDFHPPEVSLRKDHGTRSVAEIGSQDPRRSGPEDAAMDKAPAQKGCWRWPIRG